MRIHPRTLRAVIITVMCVLLAMPAVSASASKEQEQTTPADIKQKFSALTAAIKNYSVQEKKEAVADVEKNLKYLDQRIDALQKKADDNMHAMSTAAKKEMQEKLKALRHERDEVQKWLGEMKNSSGDAWEEIKKGFSDSYSRLGTAFDNAAREFSKDKAKSK